MTTITFEITTDNPQFFEALQHPEGVMDNLADAARDIVGHIKEVEETYPPTTEANQPGRYSLRTHRPMGFYERGRGWWYPIMQRSTLGKGKGIGTIVPRKGAAVTGKAIAVRALFISGVAGYKLRATSEQLGSRWAMSLYRDPHQVTVELSNSATYAPFVQGLEQARMHMVRGWLSIVAVWYLDDTQAYIQEQLEKALHEYFNA